MSILLPVYRYLDKIQSRGIHRGLSRIQKAVSLLGHPQKKYSTIHIAGTNGKGSTCHFITQLLAMSGYRVGMTLSPHVDDYRERIQIADKESKEPRLISPYDLLQTHQYLLDHLPADLELTYFEWSTLLAFQFFAEQKVDIAVLETGMGGRWDATNVCEASISGITTIGYDHMEFLGDTLSKILDEKLQIIKPGSCFVFGPSDLSLVQQAKEYCQKMGATFFFLSDDTPFSAPLPAASYLRHNLQFALRVGDVLAQKGFHIDQQAFLTAPHYSLPPARLEFLQKDPPILLDGAHNREGLLALKQYLTTAYQDEYDLIFGCLKDRPFLELAQVIKSKYFNYWAQFDGHERTTPLSVYQQVAEKLGGRVTPLDSTFKKEFKQTKFHRPLVVCGSFYLCSQFRQWYHAIKGEVL